MDCDQARARFALSAQRPGSGRGQWRTPSCHPCLARIGVSQPRRAERRRADDNERDALNDEDLP